MTERHDDDPWSAEDDELVRRALMSLMDDVSEEPLPEPAQVRARAEGRAGRGSVVDLASRRRRSLTVLAGAAAAVLVATGAALLVVNQDPDTPVATSTSERSTSTSTASSSAAPSRLRTLGPGEWEAFLGTDVDATVREEPTAHCFSPDDDSSWMSRSARQPGDALAAGQWVGTSPEGLEPLTAAVDRAVEDCEGYTRDRSMSDRLSGDGTVRAWHNRAEQGDVWWVEVTDGTSASFLTVAEAEDRTYSEADIRHLARGVLGEVDLTQSTSTPSTTSSPTTSSPTTTPGTPSRSPSTSTSTTGSPTTSEPSDTPTSSSTTTRPTPPDNSPTPPDIGPPVVGPVPASSFIPPGRWSSQALTGGERTVGGRLTTEGDGLTIDPCASGDDASAVGGLGIRSGPGEDSFFGRQFVLEHDSARAADRQVTDLTDRYSADCGGAADTRRIGGGGDVATFAMTQGDLTTYVAVAKQGSTEVTILHVTTAKTAPRPLTDGTAVRELERLAGEARR